MIKYENHCYCCDLPCINCGRKHIAVSYCDSCKEESEKLYEYADKEMCEDCLREAITKEVLSGGIDEINSFFQKTLIVREGNKYYFSDDVDKELCDYEEILSMVEEDFEDCSINYFKNYGAFEIEIEIE